MIEIRTAHYEGMFLLAQSAVADFAAAVQHVRDILARGDAEIVAMSKWDDRRFAYEIKRQKRGVYILVYFACKTDKLAVIERACNLSETVLRSMVTSAEHLTLEEMQATDAQQALADEASMRRDETPAADDDQTADEPAEQAASS